VRERLLVGAFVSGADYLKGQRVRRLLRDEVDQALGGVDVLIAPTVPIAATEVGVREVDVNGRREAVRPSLIRYTRPFNASGHPAASVPCGFTADGLPIGMQVIGRSFDEATVLRVADAYQRVTDWHTCRPRLGA
jgi:aspartyl-tRNA(Asn)/glutamyl-tRNA(Gln) amidotransferase subunit A